MPEPTAPELTAPELTALSELRNLILLTLLGLAACAATLAPRAVPAPPATPAPPAASPSAAGRKLDEALQLVSRHQLEQGLAALAALIHGPSFGTLSDDERYRALAAAGRLESRLASWEPAYIYLSRAAAMPQASAEDQLLLLSVAWHSRSDTRSAQALTDLARRWPKRLVAVDEDYVLRVLFGATRLPHGVALPLLQALYDAGWKLKWGIEPSTSWRDLALLLLEQGRVSQAIEVSARITDPQVLIDMRADRRFDALVSARPRRFDVEAAADRQVDELQAQDGGGANSLRVKALLMGALMRQQHYSAALAIADEAVADVRTTNYPERRFVDYLADYAELLNERAFALMDLGRWGQALDQLSAAARLFERGHDNIDGALALAQLDCDLQRPRDARSVLGQLTSDLSAYGVMQLESVRLDAAVQLADSRQVQRSLRYLRAHRDDATAAYLRALIVAGQLGPAARELIRELDDREARQDALESVQTYLPETATPRDLELRARWQSVLARETVQAAIDRVGRIESYHLQGAPF